MSQLEAALVGRIINERLLDEALSSGLSPEHFTSPVYKRVFAEILRADREGRQVGLVELGTCIPEHMLDLVDATTIHAEKAYGPVASMAKTVVAEDWRRRTLTTLSERARDLQGMTNLNQDLDAFRATTTTQLFDLLYETSGSATKGVVWLNDKLGTLFEDLEARRLEYENGQGRELQTGFSQLDRMLGGGFKPTSLNMVGARTSVGKTSFAINLAVNASKQGKHVVYFTHEMEEEEIRLKVVATVAGVPVGHLMRGEYLIHKHRLQKLVAQSGAHKIGIHDHFGGNYERIVLWIRRLHRQRLCDVAVIDYLGLLSSNAKPRWFSRLEELTYITGQMKGLAKELKVPLIVLSQLNRQAEGKDEEPLLSHFRDSGSIEQDCDNAILLFKKDPNSETDVFAKIGKARWGKRDKVIPFNVDFSRNTFTEKPISAEDLK